MRGFLLATRKRTTRWPQYGFTSLDEKDVNAAVQPYGVFLKMRFVAAAFFAGFLFTCYLFAGSAAVAHHALRAYDANTALTVTGTVSQYEWRNPHIQIYLSAPHLGENEEELIFEGTNIGHAERLGWSADSFRSGDPISISYNPFLDGRPGGHLIEITTGDGETYSLIRFSDRRAPTPAGSDAAP